MTPHPQQSPDDDDDENMIDDDFMMRWWIGNLERSWSRGRRTLPDCQQGDSFNI